MQRKREERGIVIPFRDEGAEAGLALEGLLVPGTDGVEGGAVVAPPHPLYGGSMDSPVVTEVAWACDRAGLPTIRFNWRGVGGSGGSPSGDAKDAAADYTAALAELEDTVEGPIVACGYSFGGAAAAVVAADRPRVERLVLVSPPAAMLDPGALARFAQAALIVTGERDDWAPAAELAEIAPEAELVVVPEADHFYMAGLADISRTVTRFLEP